MDRPLARDRSVTDVSKCSEAFELFSGNGTYSEPGQAGLIHDVAACGRLRAPIRDVVVIETLREALPLLHDRIGHDSGRHVPSGLQALSQGLKLIAERRDFFVGALFGCSEPGQAPPDSMYRGIV